MIQTYLGNCGSVIIYEVSLSLNDLQLRATSLEEIVNKAFEEVSFQISSRNFFMVTEENGGLMKGTFRRVASSRGIQSMMMLVNLGENSVAIQLEMSDQSEMF
ncbi:hypothetical protein [Paenibacillus ferrarius]|uniref:hypothetical protein n=1 Tax=Paenibacillus ferrarius TaxID=1469647 RepID=UPI003D282828